MKKTLERTHALCDEGKALQELDFPGNVDEG
jgi:hypothetical protein